MQQGTFHVQGKIDTASFTVLDVTEEIKNGRTVFKHTFKINNSQKDKWYILCAKTAEEKEEWVQAFLREREKVEQDKRDGVSLVTGAVIDSSARNSKLFF